ncbi:MAG TPA: inorganic phosphate transporter [Candidatus Sulfopaludibacter sp.]|jgi:PiT family inorganic phosphate transporter|nr:inorganic phosphate transporter [Candidatus Sulfopaludibacter sp.]
MTHFTLAVLIIAIALMFDYINGFHDAANSIATIVATRVLTPFQAVLWAAVFNFIAAFVFRTTVAKTVASGFVNLDLVTPYVILAGLMGAIAWDLITWWLGLPTSSSHALIGGYAGAAVAHSGIVLGIANSFHGLIRGQWPLTILFIFAAPLIGMISAYALMVAVYWIFQHSSPSKMDKWFRKLQLLSAAAFSLSHGANDAQKTMGIITGVLVASGFQKGFDIPVWVILAAGGAIALGTLSGGWRIVHTMGGRLTRLRPRSGFCAETGAAGAVLLATHLGLPVSTTHAIAGAIAGVGSIQRMKAVRWGIATNIVWAWVLTIPAAAIIAWCSFVLLHLVAGV